ncbi:MAG: HEAT repeat domain-containing protein, partial [Pseudomonadota bacterium]|nr:HEAT repeat domain-containing protein [Pseudomonadota bacterium]
HQAPRLTALDLFEEAHPNQFFNNYLLVQRPEILRRQPELLRFIAPPLSPDQNNECIIQVNHLFNNASDNKTTAIRAIGRLKLYCCRPLLQQLEENNLEAAAAYTQLGDECGCHKLLAASKSWQRKKRRAALPAIAFCNSPEALAILKNRATKGDRNERRQALMALGQNLHPEALPFLITILEDESRNRECRLILTLLSRHPNAAPDPKTANLLARWHNNHNLYPELMEALTVFGYGDKWEKIITEFKTPLLLLHHQKIALFMTRYADRPAIKKKLLELLSDIDWTFSFRLLILLQPHLNGEDLKVLLNLLQEHEDPRELTIQERLTKGDDLSNFNDALCEFFNSNPIQADETLSRFITGLMEGSLPTNKELTACFQRQSPELKKLLLGASKFSADLPETGLPLLHFHQLLSEITLDGSSCLPAIINRTRKYGGFFRPIINATISTIIDHDHNLQNTKVLPDLQAIINFIRLRSGYNELREKVLHHITKTTRKAKDLRIYIEASHNRDLRILNIRRNSTNK